MYFSVFSAFFTFLNKIDTSNIHNTKYSFSTPDFLHTVLVLSAALARIEKLTAPQATAV